MSTIIPVHNRPVLLVRAVESVLRQTYRPIEIIVVDDGSTDGTGRVAEELQNRHPGEIRVLHQSNGGPGSAREAGRLLARGEFIQYLDSDDTLLSHKFQRQVEGLRACPECGISYGWTRHHQLPPHQPWKRTGERMDFMFPSFLKQRGWSTLTPLYRRQVTDTAGPWTNLKQEEDWEYDCRIASKGVRLHHCDEFLADIGNGGANSLCSRSFRDRRYMADRVRARELILRHAQAAGIEPACPERRAFAQELFLLARQCGDLGFSEEARRMFDLSREAAGLVSQKEWQYKVYEAFARLAGWGAAGKLACLIDRVIIRGHHAP